MRLSAVMISSTMPSAKYSCSGSPLILAKGSTAIDGLSGRARAGQLPSPASRLWRSGPSPVITGEGGPRRNRGGVGEGGAYPMGPHRPGNIFELLLAEVFEDKIELAGGILLHPSRDAN